MEISVRKQAMLFSGSSNRELADEIATHLGMRVGEVDVSRFASGEIYVRYQDSVRGADAFVIQSHCEPVNEMIMEQLLMIDALKRASAKRINAVIPFYGYARQDRKALAREPISARMVADLLSTVGADRILSVDLHTGQIQGFFDGPWDHLTAMPLLAEYIAEKYGEDLVIVSPDANGVRLAVKYGHHIQAPIAFMQKTRRVDVKNLTETLGLIGDVKGKRCLLVDDMIDTAGTLCNAAEDLVSQGATEVVAVATHGIFSGPAIDRLKNAPISEVVVTNTLPMDADKRIDKITVLSIAQIIASTIKAVFEDESVSEIFQGEHLDAIPPERGMPDFE